jgi:hypothetical protein
MIVTTMCRFGMMAVAADGEMIERRRRMGEGKSRSRKKEGRDGLGRYIGDRRSLLPLHYLILPLLSLPVLPLHETKEKKEEEEKMQ